MTPGKSSDDDTMNGRAASEMQDPNVKAESSSTKEPSPAVDEEQLLSKLKNVPVSKLKEILTDQIDLEIRLKHKELTLTEEEIGKCESQMITLRNYYKVPGKKLIEGEPNDFTLKYYDLLNRSLSVNYEQQNLQGLSSQGNTDSVAASGGAFPNMGPVAGHSYRTRSTTSSLRPSTNASGHRAGTIGCLYRRTDGIIVKLTCPDCKRSNFSSAQGFLNHSRIAHTQEYTSQDAAALICGEILPDNEQDEEGLASLKSLNEKGLNPNKNLNVDEIYFNGLSNSLNTVHRSSIDKSVLPLDKDESKSSVITAKPRPPEESELMKKLIKGGVTKDKASYEELIGSYKAVESDLTVPDSSDEEDAKSEDPKDAAVDDKRNEDIRKMKRRRSRANVGIVKSQVHTEKDEAEPEVEQEQLDDEQESSNKEPPLPKIKLRMRPDKKKRKN
jgi:ADA HAT complex component 1